MGAETVGAGTLVLGPLVRYVDERVATVWVEVAEAAEVEVRAGDVHAVARTFAVHGHHYALVDLQGLEPGVATAYSVRVDGEMVWPDPAFRGEASYVTTLAPDRHPRLVFGSCRTSVSHDAAGHRTHGVDALRTYALEMRANRERVWPDLILFLGDQVYADETSEEMRSFIESRRDPEEPPGTELKDFEEYAHLYRLAWGEPVNRWLLSTLPSLMIFDDHDIRDDWNTSWEWRRDMDATPWWHDRIVGGLASYWIYQHLGNLSPQERAADPLYAEVLAWSGDGEWDLSEQLDEFAERADKEPASYSWSYAREIGGCRLVMVDSRAARLLEEGRRQMLDDDERAWLDGQLRGDCDHLLVATSLPVLLAEGVHHLEALSEALADGGWGRWGRRLGERLRRAGDLEHWAAFGEDFALLMDRVGEVADGRRGRAPSTVTFLSGDVHHSYVAEVRRDAGSRVLQLVCSPIRNPLPVQLRFGTAVAAYAVAAPLGRLAARSAKVPEPRLTWRLLERPHYDNNLATLTVGPDGYDVTWESGVVSGGDHEHPKLREVASLRIDSRA